MSACSETRRALTEKVTNPVNGFTTAFKEVCHEAQEKIEEDVEQPVEEWISEQQQKCEETSWWNPLRWFCEIVNVLVKVVTWVVTTLVKWVTVIVCQVVSVVVKAVVALVMVAVSWLIGFVVCLFSEPLVALESFRDLWTGILDVAEEVVNLVVTLLEDVEGILTDVESLVDTVGNMLGPVGTFLAGLVKWIINIVRGAVGIVRDLLDNLKDIVFGILRFDWCRIAAGFTGLGLDVVQTVFLVPRIVGGIVGGVRNAFNEDQVEEIVDEALRQTFARDPASLAAARKKLRITHRPFGVPITVEARRFFISSRGTGVDLRDLNRRGVIDLSAAVGLWSRCAGREAANWQRWEVVYAGTGAKVSWADVKAFLDGGPEAAPEFRVYAVPLDILLRDLRLAQRKAPQIGVSLTWTIADYEVKKPDEVPVAESLTDEIMERVGRVGTGDDMCKPPAIAIFAYDNPQRNGLTSEMRPPGEIHPSGVTFRDRLPEWFFRWILIHELGHYFGLDHPGHSGAENIMFTRDPTAGLDTLTWGTAAEYLLLSGESNFTLEDARAVWRWIPANARACLT